MESKAELKSSVDSACSTAEEFVKIYYETYDKRRHMLARMYLDTAALVWNGNGAMGIDLISKHIMELPSSTHQIRSIDTQQVKCIHNGAKLAFLIKTSGMVKYSDRVPKRYFSQTFVITTLDDKWKIVSDCFRFQDS